MSKNSLPRILGALLLYEQTPETRTLVAAPVGTKAGQFVDYLPREGKKLVALSDEQNGKVVVQPFNCVINAELLDLDEARAAASTEGTFEGLQKDGDPYGIMYANAPLDKVTNIGPDEPITKDNPPPEPIVTDGSPPAHGERADGESAQDSPDREDHLDL
ncbi:hypothetical protein [Conchiformibius steedae]|uniref:hypothetical protein n=1 Tax=Conchiformibius steedae TaxID=153493 RepID=UPI00163AACB4|nr:hypothetical protein [Conchiformibius steedae]